MEEKKQLFYCNMESPEENHHEDALALNKDQTVCSAKRSASTETDSPDCDDEQSIPTKKRARIQPDLELDLEVETPEGLQEEETENSHEKTEKEDMKEVQDEENQEEENEDEVDEEADHLVMLTVPPPL